MKIEEKKVEKKVEEKKVEEKKAEEIPAAIKEHIDDTEGEGPPVFVRGLTEQIVKDGDKVILEVEISGEYLKLGPCYKQKMKLD